MTTRANPFEEIERFVQRMSQQFPDSGMRGGWGFEQMPVDLVEHDDEFVVTVDLPGFEKDDVDVRVTDHTLRIEADREERAEDTSETYLRRERRRESMYRSIKLPEEVEKTAVDAHMRNGVLTVTVPKLDVEEAQRIEVE